MFFTLFLFPFHSFSFFLRFSVILTVFYLWLASLSCDSTAASDCHWRRLNLRVESGVAMPGGSKCNDVEPLCRCQDGDALSLDQVDDDADEDDKTTNDPTRVSSLERKMFADRFVS